ncbi:uncharacterized protein [Argopecten irradians]|uniref:uncharacterized protein n=1 Tax=Argopecten irradians TaxID=31199 RepID=UPI00371D7C4C
MDEGDTDLRQKTLSHLRNLAELAADINQPTSNYFWFNEASYYKANTEKSKQCQSCGHVYKLPEDKIRLQSKVALTGKVNRLLRKSTKNKRSLGKFQLHVMNRYLTSSNTVKITCSICGKSEKFPGQSREKRELQKKAQRAQPEEVSYVPLKTRKEKRKELKMKSKQRKREKMKGTLTTSLDHVSATSLETGQDHSCLPTSELLQGEIHSIKQTNTNSKEVSKTTPNSEQYFTQSNVSSDIGDLCQNKDLGISSKCSFQPKDSRTSKTPFQPKDSGISKSTFNTKDIVKNTVNPKNSPGQTMTSKINPSHSKDKETKTESLGSKNAKRLKSKNSHQRLSQMLAQQSSKGKKGGSLQDFLSTL